jgi:amino acid permease
MMNLSKYQYISHKGKIGFGATLFTYIKVNIVAGFLFMPCGFYNAGWLIGVCGIAFVCLLSVYCNIAIASCTEQAYTYSLSKIGMKAMGKCGYYVTEIGLAICQVNKDILILFKYII